MEKRIELNLPNSWDEVTLGKFMSLKEHGDNMVAILAVLAEKDIDEVMTYPVEVVEMAMGKMEFLLTTPYVDKPSPVITVNGEDYIINIKEKLKTGEFVAADTVLKNDKEDYASLLAILCRKDGEIYDSKFEAEMFEKRREMFLSLPVTKILPTVAFFLRCWQIRETLSELYSVTEEAANLTASNIESSTRIGALKKRSLRRQMTKLRESLKSNRPT